MKPNTNTHKPIKIKAGHYQYRGVTISKWSKTGFCAIVHPETGGWYKIGLGTLTQAMQDIDEKIAAGLVVHRFQLWHSVPKK